MMKRKKIVLKALHKELRDVANEAELIFVKYKKSNCYVDVMKIFRSRRENIAKTTKDGLKIPIPYKMMALHDTIENNYGWIVPKNRFDEESVPEKGGER